MAVNDDMELRLEEEEEDIPQMEDFFQTTLEDYDDFDQQAWSKGEGYSLPNFPLFTDRMEGLEAGMYLFAAESNIGKSAVMLNMMYDACSHEPNNLFGIYFSLDDSKYEIIPRIIAMDQMIPISVASKPQRFKKRIDNGEENSAMYHEWLEKRNQGLTKLKNMNNLFKIMDSTKIKSAEGIYECMKQLQVYVKAIDPKMNIIAAIDSVNDIKFRDRYFNSTADKHAAIAQTVKEWAVELNIPIFGSIHLRKLNQNRRPALDDLKESGEYVYEASVTFLIHNDVSKNKQAAKIYSTSEQFEGKRPIIEIDWAKNKKSSYKGRTYCYFTPEYSQVVECGQDASRRFDALIYEG